MDNSTFDFTIEPFLMNTVLKQFYCNNCSATRIYRRSFSGVPDLRHLELNNNQLEYIDANAFEENTKLRDINLEYNKLVRLSINHLPHLKHISLNHNIGFSNEHEDNLPIFHSLRIFECLYCNHRELTHAMFNKMQDIFLINLSNNKITTIHANTFFETKGLKILTLNSNFWTNENWILNSNLTDLSCVNCSLTEITINTFSKLPQLQTLDLRMNKISMIHSLAFEANPSMATLYLEANNLKKFSPNIKMLVKLSELCLDQNKFRPSYENTQLQKIYIERNLRSLQCWTQQNDQLFEKSLKQISDPNLFSAVDESDINNDTGIVLNWQTIEITAKNLTYISPDIFKHFKNLTNLIISKNYNFTLHQNEVLLNEATFTNVTIVHCPLKQIYQQTFQEFLQLKVIRLIDTEIEEISNNAFIKNFNLTEINLSNNKLETFFYILVDHLTNLKHLILDGNHLLTINSKRIFLYQPELILFSCINCMITAIDEKTFSQMPMLEKLQLSNNSITFIAKNSFFSNRKLQSIAIDGYLLKEITCDKLDALSNLEEYCLCSSDIKLMVAITLNETLPNCDLLPTTVSELTIEFVTELVTETPATESETLKFQLTDVTTETTKIKTTETTIMDIEIINDTFIEVAHPLKYTLKSNSIKLIMNLNQLIFYGFLIFILL